MNWEPLVARYGSPLYLYELAELCASHRALVSALPADARVLYSLKANPHPRLVRELGSLGCGAEVSSPAELTVALDAGMAAGEILYTGPGRSLAATRTALHAGARMFSVDSAPQLDVVREAARAARDDIGVLLRVNPDRRFPGSGLTMTGVPSPFGVDAGLLRAEPERFTSSPGCEILGLHFYLGSNVRTAGELAAQFTGTIELAGELCRKLGIVPAVLDLGGGFPRPYARPDEPPALDGIAAAVEAAMSEAFPGPPARRPRLWFESGRFLVASSGRLLATVLDVKRSRGRTFAVLDSGINHLGGMSGLGRLPRIRPAVEPASGPVSSGPETATDLVGPLCTPLDWWDRAGTHRAETGGHVVVPNVGAYGLTASLLAFLGHPCPTELVLDHGEVVDASALSVTRRAVPAHADGAGGRGMTESSRLTD